MKKRLKKKSNLNLAIMIIAIVAIVCLMIVWNPQKSGNSAEAPVKALVK
ncbi:MAG: hypothetical protein KBS95_05675 [Alistipes sp.]|nr:hypothetical protein [Candidatus Alistipes equi]